VVDASVAAKWFTKEEHSEKAVALLESGHSLHVPDYFHLEMDSIIVKWIRRTLISREEGNAIRTALERLPLLAHPVGSFRKPAFDLAAGTRVSIYDCVYLALAIALKSRMITSDHRLLSSLKGTGMEDYAVGLTDLSLSRAE